MREPARWITHSSRLALSACALALAAMLAGCGLFEDLPPLATPTPEMSNIVTNPGFEEGGTGWSYRQQPEWHAFGVSDGFARTGSRALELWLRDNASLERTRITGATQILATQEIPEFLSGYYYVDEWQPTATFQYLQMVLSVKGADFEDEFEFHEIRVPLGGIDREPFLLSNARFSFLNRDQPKLREWTYFSFPVRDAFQTVLGRVPAAFESLEVFFEVRYDDKTPAQGETRAHVYYDDLYIGTQAGNPNRPEF